MTTISEKMLVHSENCWKGCPHRKSPKTGRRIPSHIPSLLIILYGLLKMSSGSTIPNPDPELINAQNFDFAKTKLFFKNIGIYAATSTYTHVRIPFNFTTVFNTKQAITGVYDQLLEKHEEPFKSITKSIKDVSLAIIEGSLPRHNQSLASKDGDFNARTTKTIHPTQHLYCSHGHVHL
jgi:hypothetical protein